MTPEAQLLLDTHVFLWWRGNPDRIAPAAREAIAEADLVFVSVVSAWEAAVKASLGKLDLPASFEAGVVESEFEKLLVSFSHCAMISTLPWHHGDPFDRMLVAQARAEALTIVTHDRHFEPYDVAVIWT